MIASTKMIDSVCTDNPTRNPIQPSSCAAYGNPPRIRGPPGWRGRVQAPAGDRVPQPDPNDDRHDRPDDTTPGIPMPNVVPLTDMRRERKLGALPVAAPVVHTSSPPVMSEDMPSVTTSGCTRKRCET